MGLALRQVKQGQCRGEALLGVCVLITEQGRDSFQRRPVFGGILGAPGMNIGPSLVGVSISTGVTSRAVAFACSAVLVVLAFLPKVADVLLQLPLSVAGALLVFTASIMLASGLQLMLARPLDARFTFVIGVGLLFPLTRLVSLEYFEHLPGLSIVTNSGQIGRAHV